MHTNSVLQRGYRLQTLVSSGNRPCEQLKSRLQRLRSGQDEAGGYMTAKAALGRPVSPSTGAQATATSQIRQRLFLYDQCGGLPGLSNLAICDCPQPYESVATPAAAPQDAVRRGAS